MNSRSSIWSDQLLFSASQCAPVLFILCWIPLSLAIYPIAELQRVWPELAVVVIFFYALFRPGLMPYGALFVLGLFHDSLTLQPLGLSSVQFMAMRALTCFQSRLLMQLPFWMQWAVFASALLALQLSSWIVIGLYQSAIFPLMPLFSQWLVTIACYPFMHRVMYAHYHWLNTMDRTRQQWEL